MKKIGEGFYCYVFEDNNSIIKIHKKNKIYIFLYIFLLNIFNIKNTIKDYKSVVLFLATGKDYYKRILDLIEDKSIIGNPIFLNGIDYKQEKAELIININNYSEEEFKKIVIDFTDLIKKLWSYKVSYSVFNFSNNCGYDKNKKLFLFDFNEMTFEKEEVKNHIIENIWLKRWSYKILNNKNKKIYKELMQKEITQENLEKFWGNKIF